MTKKKIKELFSHAFTNELEAEIELIQDTLIEKALTKYCESLPKITDELKPFVRSSEEIMVELPYKTITYTMEESYPLPVGSYKHKIEIKDNKDIDRIKLLRESIKTIEALLEDTLKVYTDYELFVMFPELTESLAEIPREYLEVGRETFETMLETIKEYGGESCVTSA